MDETSVPLALIHVFTVPYGLMLALPGPNAIVVVRASLTGSCASATSAAFGVACGATVSLGLAAALASFVPAVKAVEIVGTAVFAAILVRAAIRTLRGAARQPVDPDRLLVRHDASAFGLGLAAALTNPMSVPFFMSFFLTEAPRLGEARWLVFGVAFLMAFVWFAGLGLVFAGETARRFYLAGRRPLEAVIAVSLLVFAGRAIWRISA